ncbi:spermine/spermidine synthase [Novosphingobium kunmingense]|uniref:Spermine/spermidine synthase n=1 Tax=Novosphingobium kunmingense TaxID=1211806 RepID=A0A2N0I3Z7_9SPHN|nr:spermidine synthase [Novosphingobium kunmingense]PKB25909.1 spermine/spermidine synthase [Novosphingobium kunmingense]
MITRQLLGTAQVPGGEELKLYAHDRDFMIVLGHNELMSTRQRASEEALANLTLDRLQGRRAPHLLIGGYGMGFTLRAALKRLGPEGRATVAELVPEIIQWARGPMAGVAEGCLDDPRVRLVMDDVADAMLLAPDPFDAILLDVDNGPDGLVRADNNRIYAKSGLHNARRALAPGGVLAIWSAFPDKAFTRRLESVGFVVEEVEVRARVDKDGKGKGPRHTIWFAREG